MATVVDDVVKRAFAAYFRSGGDAQPSNASDTVKHRGKQYVRLSSGRGTLAIYRVRTNGILKRLKRWPAELNK